MTRDIKEICKALHLAYIADRFEEVPYETKEQFLRDVLALEVSSRQEAKRSKLIKKAKFRELKWLKDYEWSDHIHWPSTTTKEELCDLVVFGAETERIAFGIARNRENPFSHGFRIEGMRERP